MLELFPQLSFWFFLVVIIYAYIGYGVLLFMLIKVKRLIVENSHSEQSDFSPTVTLLIAAYNEEDFIETKIKNSLDLDYPEEKLNIHIVTDGSDDKTPEIVSNSSGIVHHHLNERKGKLAAVDRVIPMLDDEIIVFSDANTLFKS